MKRINVDNWKFFSMKQLGFCIYHGARLKKTERISGKTPFLTAGHLNQGLGGYIGNNCITYYNPITVDMFGNCFYHSGNYAGDDNIYFFVNDKLSENIKLFLAAIIHKNNKSFYSYKQQYRQPNADVQGVLLPVTDNGAPDFVYIDNYIKALKEKTLQNLIHFQKIYSSSQAISTKTWNYFVIESLFKKVELRIKKENFSKTLDVSLEKNKEFSIPLINAKDGNNGIMYYGRVADFETETMCLDVVQNGAVATGNVYAQPQATGILWDAYLIKPIENVTEYTLLFLARVLQTAIKKKYSYDDKAIWDKVKKDKIKLPVNSNGSPDWVYMDKFMKVIADKAETNLTLLKTI